MKVLRPHCFDMLNNNSIADIFFIIESFSFMLASEVRAVFQYSLTNCPV